MIFLIHRLQGIIPTKYHIFEEDGHDDAMRKFIGKLTGWKLHSDLDHVQLSARYRHSERLRKCRPTVPKRVKRVFILGTFSGSLFLVFCANWREQNDRHKWKCLLHHGVHGFQVPGGQALAFCQTLPSQDMAFNFSLAIGASFSLDTRDKAPSSQGTKAFSI